MKWYFWLAIAIVLIITLYLVFGKKKETDKLAQTVKSDGSIGTQNHYNFDPYQLTLIK